MLLAFEGRQPRIHPSAFIAPTAVLVGDVVVEEEASVWFGCVLRADDAWIRIGPGSNVQDLAQIHADAEHPVSVGESVTIGHGAIIHACTVESEALVGIGSIVLDGVVVGRGAVVAAGAVVRPGTVVQAGGFIRGLPASEGVPLSTDRRTHLTQAADDYRTLAKRYTNQLGSITKKD
jgi:carbonic anhydrase/acetyltransferase-like protein (isoleucine patch superfamily)